MAYKKTAKDKAWDRERQKLQSERMEWVHKCGEKERKIQSQANEIIILKQKIAELESAINYVSEGKYTPDQLVSHMERVSAINGLLKICHNNSMFF